MQKGLVYTMSVFLIVAVFLELALFWVGQMDKRLLYSQPQPDGEVLIYKLDELSSLSMQAMGLDAQMARTSTALTLNISDAGFPFVGAGAGRIQVSKLEAWSESASGWQNATNSSLKMDVSVPNGTGLLLSTSGSKLNYTHDNTESTRDNATLNLSKVAGYVPTAVRVDITCTRPAGGIPGVLDWTDWSNTGGSMNGVINFLDATAGWTRQDNVQFDPSTPNAFNATYRTNANSYAEVIHVDWGPDYLLQIWAEPNPARDYTKADINCTWNISTTMNFPNANAETLYVPIHVILNSTNANYSGNLVLARK